MSENCKYGLSLSLNVNHTPAFIQFKVENRDSPDFSHVKRWSAFKTTLLYNWVHRLESRVLFQLNADGFRMSEALQSKKTSRQFKKTARFSRNRLLGLFRRAQMFPDTRKVEKSSGRREESATSARIARVSTFPSEWHEKQFKQVCRIDLRWAPE